MLRITKLEIGAFKLFEGAEICFEGREGLTSLEGDNRDLEGFSSNSVGKSTFISALLQGLYGKGLNNDSLEKCTNLYTGKKPNITVHFTMEEDVYKVVNNYNKGTLRMFKNGEVLQITQKKELFKEIERVLKLSQFLLQHLIYVSPTSSSLFSSADATAQNKFIQQLLSLEFIADLNKRVSADLASYSGSLNMALKEIELKTESVKALTSQLGSMPEASTECYIDRINEASGDLSRLEELKQGYSKKLKEATTTKKGVEKLVIEKKSELKYKKAEHKRQLELIEESTCPTCEQDTTKLPVPNKRGLITLEDELEQLEEKLSSADDTCTKVETGLLKTSSEIAVLRDSLNTMKSKQALKDAQAGQDLLRDSLHSQRERYLNDLLVLQKDLTALEQKVYILDLIKTCSSAKGFSKERVGLFLKLYNIELGLMAKALLGSQYVVEITKNKANFALTVDDGEAKMEYSSLSSGYQARMDIVLVLALNKAVETLTGTSVNILVLDEVLSNIDAEGVAGVERLLIKVEKMFPTKCIFLVSHNQFLRSNKSVLKVVREDNVSNFEWE